MLSMPEMAGRVTRERLPSAESVNAELVRVLFLLDRLKKLVDGDGSKAGLRREYRLAYEVSLSPSSSGDLPTLGRGFQESDPTGQTATNARLRQLRWRAGKSARCVTRAITALEEAGAFLDDGFNELDDAEWGRWVAERLEA